MSRRTRAVALSLVVPSALAVALSVVPPGQAAPGSHPGGNPKVTTEPAAARAALADARALFSERPGAARGAPDREATMVLRRLWQQTAQLQGPDLAAARALLARPSLPDSMCTPANCYHWTTTGADAVDATDSDTDGVPDYVETVASVVDHVRATYAGAGYRTPERDDGTGGNRQTDIYLEDDGAQGLYGYCTSDQPIPPGSTRFDAWAYCSLDNDYDPVQFPTNTPLENLEVTAAHEYFHAVQFAYDAFEDSWFMEATATWAEDELYDAVDDNLQYLPNSQLALPGQPLDTFSDGAGPQYGDWIFFRYLTESMPASVGGLPTLVRDLWRRADGAPGGPDDYSVQAISRVLRNRGTSLTRELTGFAVANRRPGASYDEGRANHYPTADPAGTFRLTRARRDSHWLGARTGHLSSVTARFVPGAGLRARAWRLRLSLDLPPARQGFAAAVTVQPRSGRPHTSMVRLDRTGAATTRVPFGSSRVRYVEATLVNADAKYDCWTGGPYSCQGSAKGDGKTVALRAVATR